MGTFWLALAILGGVLAVNAVVWVGVVLWLRRRSAGVRSEVEAEVGSGDYAMGPEHGSYRGGTGRFPRVKGNSWIALTPDRLLVRPLVGKPITVALSEVTGTRVARTWLGSWTAGITVLVISTVDGELGIAVRDPAAWQAALPGARR